MPESPPRRLPPRPPPAAPAPARRAPWTTVVALALLALLGVAGAACLALASAARAAERRAAALDDELITVRRLLIAAEAGAERARLERDEARAAAGRGATAQAASALVELGPERAVGAGAATEYELDLGTHRPPAVLVLRLGRRPVEAVYRVEIVDLRGERVWRSEALRRAAGDRFVVVLPGGSLSLGRHELRLLGGRAGEERPLLTWYLQIVAGA